MRNSTFSLLILSCMGATAQHSMWDVHPLNMVPCQEWINPEPGCGGCSSCRSATDSDPLLMDGGLLHWSPDLIMCPHPVDNQGNNAVVISNWPISPDADSYLYGRMEFHEAMRIDTLELTCAAWAGGPDSVEIAIQFNQTDPQQTTTLLKAALTSDFTHYTVTGIGNVPMAGASGVANFFVRAHGGDQWFLFKGIRVVATQEMTASVAENGSKNVLLQPMENGVSISTSDPIDVSICDASGRVTRAYAGVRGNVLVPLADGLNIVRAGSEVRRFVR